MIPMSHDLRSQHGSLQEPVLLSAADIQDKVSGMQSWTAPGPVILWSLWVYINHTKVYNTAIVYYTSIFHFMFRIKYQKHDFCQLSLSKILFKNVLKNIFWYFSIDWENFTVCTCCFVIDLCAKAISLKRPGVMELGDLEKTPSWKA